MRQIDNYIQEKLHISKNLNVTDDLPNEVNNIISMKKYLEYYGYEAKTEIANHETYWHITPIKKFYPRMSVILRSNGFLHTGVSDKIRIWKDKDTYEDSFNHYKDFEKDKMGYNKYNKVNAEVIIKILDGVKC